MKILVFAVTLASARLARAAVCGDGTCESPETCSGCPSDCGDCNPDSYCVVPEAIGWNSADGATAVWTVDDDLATAASGGELPRNEYPWTVTDVRQMTDMILGNAARHSRARMRQRVLQGTGLHCGGSTRACFYSSAGDSCTVSADCPNAFQVCTNGLCNSCGGGVNIAAGGCSNASGKCFVVLCQGKTTSFPDALLPVATHEVGHAYALDHPEDTGVTTCTGRQGHPNTAPFMKVGSCDSARAQREREASVA